MKIKYSKIIPFKGFYAINLFGTYFVRKEYEGEKNVRQSNRKVEKYLTSMP